MDELRVAIVLITAGLMLVNRRSLGFALLMLGLAVYVRSLLVDGFDGGGWGGGGGHWWPAGGPGRPDPAGALRKLADSLSAN